MKFKSYKISPLNESLLGNTNMEYPTDDIEVKGAVPVDFAAAIDEHQRRVEKNNETFKEFKKKAEEFVEKNHNREVTRETTAEMKKMHLSEAVDFGDPMEFGRGPCVPIVTDYTRQLQDAVAALEDERTHNLAMKELRIYINQLVDYQQSVDNFNEFWAARYPAVTEHLQKQIAIVPKNILNQLLGIKESFVNVDVPITANGNRVPFMNGGVKTEDVDPDFFEVNEDDILTEAPVAVMEPEVKKKRTRGPNEKPDIADYSSEDLWYAVYDELSATTDHEGEGKTVNKQLKARRGERYEHVYPHGDTDLIVYAMKPEDFEFAKKVADHYGVVAEEPKEDRNPTTNGYYKYSMVIRIPADELYTY